MKENRLVFTVFLAILMLMPSCTKSGLSSGSSGAEGISISFLSNRPPDKVVADSAEVEVPIMIEVRNKGAFPKAERDSGDGWDNNDVVFVSGYDPNILTSWKVNGKGLTAPIALMSDKSLEGKGSFSPNGGYDTMEFSALLSTGNLKQGRFKQSFLVTACYQYRTRADTNVCIDPEPYAVTTEKKVCQIGPVSLSSQGAPITITKIEEEVLRNSIQFKIYFKNAGKGEVLKKESLAKCGPVGQGVIDRKDIGLIRAKEVRVGGMNIEGSCKPRDNEGYARLVNNEGFVICSMPKEEGGKNVYSSAMFIELEYGYRDSISKTVEIVNVPTG